MTRLWFATCLAVLGSTLAAQSYRVSPHSIYTNSEGPSYALNFGSYSAGRYQFADGNFRGVPMTIKGIAFRHDHRVYNESSGMGRGWINATISMADTEVSGFGATFNTNATATPTLVFNLGVTWPVQLGVPTFTPMPFALNFPFAVPWAYSGNKDMMSDFRFTGGALHNQMPWSGSTAVPYALDSFTVGTFAAGQHATLGNINGGCSDSGWPSVIGASIKLSAVSYGPSYPTAALRNKIFTDVSGANFPPLSNVLAILTFLGSPTGFQFPGIFCNNLHIDIRRTLFFHPQTTNVVGTIPSAYLFGLPGGLGPYLPSLTGVNIVAQGVWADTVTQQLKFSAASRNSLVAVPPFANEAAVGLRTAYTYDSTMLVAPFTAVGRGEEIPLLRYAY